MGQRFWKIALVLQDGAIVTAGIQMAGIAAECLAKGMRRFVDVALLSQGDAQVIVGIREVGPQPQGLPAVGHGFGQETGVDIDRGEVTMENRVRTVDRECAVNQVDSLPMPARLMGQHTQKVECLGMLGRFVEDAAVQRFGFLEPACFMVLDSAGELLC
jgi:hypothetical protein